MAHPKRAIAFVAVTLAMTIGAYVAGYSVGSPSDALEDADEVVSVFADAEIRSVSDGVRVSGEVTAGRTVDVAPAAPAGTSVAVVTEQRAEAGGTVQTGSILGVVSGRPTLALSMPFTLYRALTAGMVGADVSALQRALGVNETGRLDAATLRAFSNLYREVGFAPPGDMAPYVEPSELVILPSASATVIRTAAVGAVVSTENPLVSLQVEPNTATARVSIRDIESISGADGLVATGLSGTQTPVGLLSVGPFVPGGQNADGAEQSAGYDVVFSFTDPASLEQFPVGESVTVTTGTQAEPSLAVPLEAIRQDDAGAYVLVESVAAEAELERLRVEVLAQDSGWVAVRSDELTEGTRVLVSGA